MNKKFNSWTEYAVHTVTQALEKGDIDGNYPAITAAEALVQNWEGGHQSYYNTQFAVGAFFLPCASDQLRLYAWRMVLNGLGGYWQWESHNGGKFSITKALVHLELLTDKEVREIEQFNIYETHSGCHYFVVDNNLLARLVKKFNLPTKRLNVGGKEQFTIEEFNEREYFMDRCFIGKSDGSYSNAYRSM